MKVFVVFGSQSDEKVYEPFCKILEERDFGVDFEVISAHRNPKELARALEKKSYDVVVAGAGLSAHLPGVVASQVKVPVFGIPVAAHFGGLDSLFSIFQMPFGVPVMSCLPGRASDIADFLQACRRVGNMDEVNIVIDQVLLNYEYVNLELDRTKKYMEDREISHHISETPRSDRWNICLARDVDDIHKGADAACLHVPILDKSVLQSAAQGNGSILFDEKRWSVGRGQQHPQCRRIVLSIQEVNNESSTNRSSGKCQKHQKGRKGRGTLF